MSSVSENETFEGLQSFNRVVYGKTNDRWYSIWDLLTQEQRFTMRAIKGIRKDDKDKIQENLLIALSWLISVINRLHVDIDKEIWARFPMVCLYCKSAPCKCESAKSLTRYEISVDLAQKPKTIGNFQEMFELIYPKESRTLADAGIHLAEEAGELSESLHNYHSQHQQGLFAVVKNELADVTSCIFGVANSADINIAKELNVMFSNDCHVCHKSPCACTFASVTKYQS